MVPKLVEEGETMGWGNSPNNYPPRNVPCDQEVVL